jgi:hypothetical protein
MNSILKFAVALMLVPLLVTVANADESNDGKSYSPALCAPTFNGPAYGNFGNPSYTRLPWSFGNNSGFSIFVTCPIVKDNEFTQTGLNYADINIFNPSGSTTSCLIYSLSVQGNVLAQSPFISTSTEGETSIILFPYPSVSEFYGGSYGILCNLPNGAAIKSYHIVEN